MSSLSPTTLKALCKEYDLSPSKAYGQNFLISDAPIKKMIYAAELSKKDTVIEVGPGFGILTFALAEKAKKVIAFEIEKKLEPYWAETCKEYENVELVWGNVLNQCKMQNGKSNISYKVVANLPYQITSQILRFFLEAENKPSRLVVTVQKEVAQRMVAKPGDMSLLAVSVQYFGTPKVVSYIKKGSFWPVPKVDSAIVKIDTHENRPSNTDAFFRIVKAGFANKRKQLWKNLSTAGIDGSAAKRAITDVTGNEKVRAQELDTNQWNELVGRIS
jgi:16S rRNA (adenine1518-N6/adenine1519-N6)-dimethyltransferase